MGNVGTRAARAETGSPLEPGSFRITSVASAGQCEGLPATQASIFPQSMAVGPHGEIAFVDQIWGSVLVRTVDGSGKLHTVGWVPPGSDRSQFGTPTDVPGLPTLQRLGFSPLAYDPSGRLLINDGGGHRLYAFQNGELVPIVGNGDASEVPSGDGGRPLEATLADALAVSTDRDGNIYVTDFNPKTGQSAIRFVNEGEQEKVFYPGTARELTVPPNTIQTIATIGPADDDTDGGQTASFAMALRVTPDAKGNLFFAVDYNDPAALGSVFDPGSWQSRVRVLNTTGSTETLNGVSVEPGAIATIAGSNANSNLVKDGIPARLYRINTVSSEAVAVDASGNVYFPMLGRAKIMKVDPSGIITTFVGEDPDSSYYYKAFGAYAGVSGDATYTPPGRDHSVTAVGGPIDVAMGPDGKTLYYAGRNEFDIRRVDPDGIVRQVAGNSFYRYCGDGGPAAATDPLSGPKLSNYTQVATYQPRAVADGQGNVYIADILNNVIRKVSPDGVISTVVGNPQPCTVYGYSFALPPVCDGGFSGDGGPATKAELSAPMDLALDQNGLYIADLNNGAVRYVNFSSHTVRVVGVEVAPGAIQTVVGADQATRLDSNDPPQAAARSVGPACNVGENYNADAPIEEQLNARQAQICPLGIAVAPNGDLFVDDGINRGAVYRVDGDNHLTQVAGRSPDDAYSLAGGDPYAADWYHCPDAGVADRTSLCLPASLAVDELGNVYFVQYGGSALDDSYWGPFVSYINFLDHPVTVNGVTVPPGEIRRVAGARGPGAYPVTPCAVATGDGGAALDATFCGISGIAERDGYLFISDSWNARIAVVDPGGTVDTFSGGAGTVVDYGNVPDPWSSAYGGDGGLARDATFLLPGKPGIPEEGGYLLLSDSGDYRVRMIVDCENPRYSQSPVCTNPLPSSSTAVPSGSDQAQMGPSEQPVVDAFAGTASIRSYPPMWAFVHRLLLERREAIR